MSDASRPVSGDPRPAPPVALPQGALTDLGDQAEVSEMQALGAETQDALAMLAHGLGASAWRVRKEAIAAVARFPVDEALLALLIGGLGVADNVGLRNACAEALTAVGPAAVPALTAALATLDVDKRKFVVEALGAIGGTEAVTALLGALEQDDANVRAAVVDALGHCGGSAVQGQLLARLAAAGDELQLCVYLLEALLQTGARLPAATLLPYLGRRPLARFVYPLLGTSRDPAASAPLVDAALGDHRGNRRIATQALARLVASLPAVEVEAIQARLAAAPGAEVILVETLGDADPAVAGSAMALLGTMRAAAAAPLILQHAAAAQLAQVGLEAVEAIGSTAQGPLLAVLGHADTQVQMLVLDALEAVGDGRAADALLALAQAAQPHVAAAAVRLVGRFGDESHAAPLMALVAAREEATITCQVAGSLGRIGERAPQAVAAHVRRAIGAGDVQPAWLTILGSLTRPQDLDVILAATRHQSPAVRDAAFAAAQGFAASVPEDVICLGLADPHPQVRAAAARLAPARGEPRVVAALLHALADRDPWVVTQAARALGRLRAVEAVPHLITLTLSPNAPVAIAALQALGHLDAPGRATVLADALGHPDSEVVREALAAAATVPDFPLAAAAVTALGHRAWDVRAAAAEQLRRLRHPVDRRLIEQVLSREDEPLVRDRLALLRPSTGGRP